MIRLGDYNDLKIIRQTSIGLYLEDEAEGILLPKRFVTEGCQVGDLIRVFIYHDKEGRVIATTQKPIATVGEIALLQCVTTTYHGAYLDNGLMKDLFVPRKNQFDLMQEGQKYLVKIYLDLVSGKLAGTERLDPYLNNETLTVKTNEEVQLTVYRKTNIGYHMIINGVHSGILHKNEIYRTIKPGDRFKGYIKNILPGNKIDVVADRKHSLESIGEGAEKIMEQLKANNDFLPYHDKTDPAVIYSFFGISKKAFKQAVGALYKKKLIVLEESGIRRVV